MPDFILTAPGGEKYKVTAPDEQSAVGAFKKMTAQGPSQAGNALDPVMQGLTFGFGDEIAGGVGGLMEMAGGGSFGEGYSRTRDRARGDVAGFRERNPKTAVALEIADCGRAGYRLPLRVD